MLVQHLFQPFEIEQQVADRCPVKLHKHTFFELVFIIDGSGFCVVNNQRYAYGKDDVFVIIPEHGHHTIVTSTTTFIFVRFTLNSFHPGADNEWMERLEYIFYHQQRLLGKSGSSSKPLLRALAMKIVEEYDREQRSDTALISQLIRTLLMVIVHEIDDDNVTAPLPRQSALRRIMDYVHAHIRDPKKLTVERIANHVHMSKNYVSEYFRKHSPKPLQQYILEYKMRLVEERLVSSDLNLSEIAHEFGFSGESHLATAFKKFHGISPVKYRKKVLVSV